MSELILHHYDGSPYAEKIRLILGFKGLAWDSVEISETMPRPDLMPLTGGHRRSPVLQIGADVYCDTRRIALQLEDHAPEPTLFPEGSRTLCELFANWVEPRIFLAAGVSRFQSPEDVLGVFEGRVSVHDFVADRTPFMLPALDATCAQASEPAALDQLRSFLGTLGHLLCDERSFLSGDRPALADFSAYHTLWFLLRTPRKARVLEEFPELDPWLQRVSAIGHGKRSQLNSKQALERARTHEPDLTPIADPRDPAGRKPGDWVRVSADDYGRDEVLGRIVALRPDSISIQRQDPQLGSVVNHFPRIGFRVLPEPSPA